MTQPQFFDTHVHLDHERFDEDRDAVLSRAAEAGVARMIQVSYDLESSRRSCDLVRSVRSGSGFAPELWCAVGVHPHDADTLDAAGLDVLRDLLEHRMEHRIVAVGEIGLDYHYDLSPRDVQKEAFLKQLQLAAEYGLPVILHEREAHADCLDVLREFGMQPGNPAGLGGSSGRPGVFHCFSGSPETAQTVLDLGFYLGFDGPLTFSNARRAPDVVRMAPRDRLLVETDCPFLAPVPYRGKRNEPAFVERVVARMAELLDCTAEEAASLTAENACRLFGISS